MSIPKRPEVRIANPANGCGWTSLKRAEKLIARGRARRLAPDLIEITAAPAHKQGQHYVNLAVIPSSHGTREWSTFGHYPMFPREFGRAAVA